MCSVLPEDKQGPVLDDIRKISKDRRRYRGAARITTADDGLIGVYRSMSELSVEPAVVTTVADEDGANRSRPGSSLMATVRAARRRQSMSTTVVYNPAFYEAPVAQPSADRLHDNPAGQPYLRMTAENGFSLHRERRQTQRSPLDADHLDARL